MWRAEGFWGGGEAVIQTVALQCAYSDIAILLGR